MSAPVSLERVTKVYDGEVRAVDDVSLDVAAGEFVVLVGPSGCGKSTLLRMIAGLERVTAGTVRIGGEDVTTAAPPDRDIAMVFQNYALYPNKTVAENLAFGLRQRKTPKEEVARRVGEMSAMLGLEELMARRPAQLSGGQRQRVAMGRALVREPQVFLLDEPLSNLDAKLRTTMRAELARLHERLGITTVYVTHDQVEAMTLGQRVAVMRDGVLQQFGDPQTLFHQPVNLFVAAFIGSPTMNLVSAPCDGERVAFAGFSLPLGEFAGTQRRRRAGAAAGVVRAGGAVDGPGAAADARSRPSSSRRSATRRWSPSASTRRRCRSRRCAPTRAACWPTTRARGSSRACAGAWTSGPASSSSSPSTTASSTSSTRRAAAPCGSRLAQPARARNLRVSRRGLDRAVERLGPRRAAVERGEEAAERRVPAADGVCAEPRRGRRGASPRRSRAPSRRRRG